MKIQQVAWTLTGSLLVFVACASSKDAVQALTTPDSGADSLAVQDDSAAAVDTSAGPEAATEAGADSTSILDAVLDALDAEGDAKADGTPTAGTRIKPIVETIAFTDGAKLVTHVGWWDSMRAEECDLVATPTMKTRCMPVKGAGISVYYSDAACTLPLYARTKSAKVAAKYALAPGSTSSKPRLLPVVGDTTNPAKVYSNNLGPCALQDFDAVKMQAVSVGAEVPETDFVEATDTLGHE